MEIFHEMAMTHFVEYGNFLLKANEIESSRISNIIVEIIDEKQEIDDPSQDEAE